MIKRLIVLLTLVLLAVFVPTIVMPGITHWQHPSFFAFFPAGLVLYWATNAGLSLAQQWYITRKIAAAD